MGNWGRKGFLGGARSSIKCWVQDGMRSTSAGWSKRPIIRDKNENVGWGLIVTSLQS